MFLNYDDDDDDVEENETFDDELLIHTSSKCKKYKKQIKRKIYLIKQKYTNGFSCDGWWVNMCV